MFRSGGNLESKSKSITSIEEIKKDISINYIQCNAAALFTNSFMAQTADGECIIILQFQLQGAVAKTYQTRNQDYAQQ